MVKDVSAKHTLLVLTICIFGNDPDPLSKVGSSDIGSSQHSPSSIEPHRGQVSENHSESSNSEHWRVFHERIAWSYFTDDSRHFHPESGALAGDSGALSGGADVLTGKAARNHVNTAAPRSSVKAPNVIPYRERREKAVILSGDKYARGIGVVLDGADGAPAEEVSSEYASTCPGEQGKFA
jgi:hypothetical protein